MNSSKIGFSGGSNVIHVIPSLGQCHPIYVRLSLSETQEEKKDALEDLFSTKSYRGNYRKSLWKSCHPCHPNPIFCYLGKSILNELRYNWYIRVLFSLGNWGGLS